MTVKDKQQGFQPIATLTEDLHEVDVRFKVIGCSSTRIVTSKRTGKKYNLQEIVVADETAMIKLVLWNDSCESFEVGGTYMLRQGILKVYDFSMQLSVGRKSILSVNETDIESPNIEMDMSRPFMGRKKKRKKALRREGRTFYGAPGRTPTGYCTDKEF